MNKNSGALLRDIRNIKKNNPINFTMSSKEIMSSSKDIKKARSSEQIYLKGFLDNKHDKIKNIDEKLQLHQGQIEKNNLILQNLTHTLEKLRNQLIQEKAKVDILDKKNKNLLEEIERTNKLMRIKNNKVEDLTKKLENSDKEIQSLKSNTVKIEELNKINSQLRKQITSLEETSNNRKQNMVEKQKENQKLKEKISCLGGIKKQFEDVKALLNEKDLQIKNLNSYLTGLEEQKKLSLRISDEELKSLGSKLKQSQEQLRTSENSVLQYRKQQITLKQKIASLEDNLRRTGVDMQTKNSFEKILKKELEEIKRKFNDVNEAMNKKNNEDKAKDQKINSMKNKIGELKKKLDTDSGENEKLKNFGEKVQTLQKQTNNLSNIYKSIVPQIQCPFGHELKDPVTIIPCGHNYCLGCKKGYTKSCTMCNGKLKIQAVYRNQLMDDIINMTMGIKEVLYILK